MPIDLGGLLPPLPDPLGLFSRQGNNGVGTGARLHPVFGENGRGAAGPEGGVHRGQDGPGQYGNGNYGNGNVGSGPGRGGHTATPVHLPPTTPVPMIPSPANPVAVVNQVVQGLHQALPGQQAAPGTFATAGAFAAPGTPAFTGGAGQPALPATMAALGTTTTATVTTVAQAPIAAASVLARAMNHAGPMPSPQQPGGPHSPLAWAHSPGAGQMPAHARGGPAQGPMGHMGPAAQASANAHATQAQLYSAAHRATETPVAPRMPVSQNHGFQAASQASQSHAFQPASHASQLAHGPSTRPAPMPMQAPQATNTAHTAPAAQAAQTAHTTHAAHAQPANTATATPPGAEARAAQQGAQAGARSDQPAQAPQSMAASTQPAAGTTQASQASVAATQQAQQAQLAAPLAAALAAGSTTAEARPVVPTGNERSQVLLDASQNPSGHTAERGMRRSLRSRVEGAQRSLLRMLGLSMLDAGLQRHPDGHTAIGMEARTGQGLWFALPWLFWLLAVVAYGCLTLALIVMVGPVVGGGQAGTGGAVMPIVLGVGLAAGVGAWMMMRARRGAQHRSRHH